MRVALVTGANKGLGFQCCIELGLRKFRVILTARDPNLGEMRAKELKTQGFDVIFHPLDVQSDKSIEAIGSFIKKEIGQLDVLINNAAVLLDIDKEHGWSSMMPSELPLDIFQTTWEINVKGPFHLCQIFAPMMLKQGYGRIVNVSSELGQLSTMSSGEPSYRISKAALNAVTRVFAKEYSGTNVLINSVSPGWVRTDMGGPLAPRSLEKGAETIIWAASLPDGGPTGQFFQDKTPLDW